MNSIVLGIFSEFYNYLWLISKHNLQKYPFENVILDNTDNITLMEYVSLALSRCNRCYFIIDGIKAPIEPELSVTCEELEYLMNHPYHLDKVIFYYRQEEITLSDLSKILKINIDGVSNNISI